MDILGQRCEMLKNPGTAKGATLLLWLWSCPGAGRAQISHGTSAGEATPALGHCLEAGAPACSSFPPPGDPGDATFPFRELGWRLGSTFPGLKIAKKFVKN